MRSVIVLTMVLAGAMAFAAAPPAKVPAEWLKLIDQLGDDDDDVRKAAETKLDGLGEDVLPALHRASRTLSDVDARLRAGVVAEAIRKRLFGEVRVFEGHTWWAFRVAVTPDGKHAVSSGDFLRVWDLNTGKEVRKFAPNARSWGLSISKDGKHVLASQNDFTVRLYELESGKEVHQFAKHTNEVWAATLSPDGKRAVTGSLDQTLQLWDVENGKHLLAFEGVTDYPRCAAFSPDGKKVVVGHSDNTQWNFVDNPATVRVWDAETGKLLLSEKGHTSAITAVAWSKDGKTIASSSFDKTVRIWDAKSLKHVKTLKVSEAGCDHVAFTPDAKQIVTTGCGNDHAVRVWDVETGRQVRRFDGHTSHALCVAVTADGEYAVSSGSDHTLRLWRMPKKGR